MTTPLAEKSAKTPELSTTHSPLGTHGLWGDKNAQLPAYVQNIAKAMMRNGHDESSAIALAIGSVKRWARGGGKVSPEVRAAAGKAVAEWEKLKAEHSKSKAGFEPDLTKFNPFEHRDSRGQWTRANTAEIVGKIQELHRKGEGSDYRTLRDAVRDVQSGNWHSAADHVDTLADRLPSKGTYGSMKDRKEVGELRDVAAKLREAHVSDPLRTHQQEAELGMEPDAGVLAEAAGKSNEDLERDIGFRTPSDGSPYDPQKAEAAKRTLMDRTILGEYRQETDPDKSSYGLSGAEGVNYDTVAQAYRDLHAQWTKVAPNYAGKSAAEADVEKFRLPHFNPAELRDAHGRWSRQNQERKLQSALRESNFRDEPKAPRAERRRIKTVSRGEPSGPKRNAVVPYRSNTGTPSEFNPPTRDKPLKIRANAGEDKPAPAYLRSDIHVLSTSQKYTDEQVQQLQNQLDELKGEIRKETHKDTRFMNALQFGSVVAAIGMELLSMHTGGFGLMHGGEGEAAGTGLAVALGLTMKELPHLVEPVIDYAHHLKGHKGKVIGKPAPYAKKADATVIAQVAGLIATGLENGGVERDDAQRFAAIVTNAAAEARDAGRREYERGFIDDDQARKMLGQFGGDDGPKA